jgi:hypothetical protein
MEADLDSAGENFSLLPAIIQGRVHELIKNVFWGYIAAG